MITSTRTRQIAHPLDVPGGAHGGGGAVDGHGKLRELLDRDLQAEIAGAHRLPVHLASAVLAEKNLVVVRVRAVAAPSAAAGASPTAGRCDEGTGGSPVTGLVKLLMVEPSVLKSRPGTNPPPPPSCDRMSSFNLVRRKNNNQSMVFYHRSRMINVRTIIFRVHPNAVT